jgi:hypothetical protein
VASRIEPQVLQEIAKSTDKDVKRKPAGFTDALKMGVPGLRQQVPINETAAAQQRRQGFQDRFLKGQITEDDLDRAAKRSELSQSDINSILKEKDIQDEYTPFQAAFYKAPVLTSNKTSPPLDRFERMDAVQRAQVRQIMVDKAESLLDSDALTGAQKQKFAERLKAVGIEVNYGNQ